MGPKLQHWLHLVSSYHLDDRYREVRQWREMAEAGFVDEHMAEALIYAIQPAIVEQERRPNYLHRAPDFEELYPQGPPDLVIGRLSENEEVPIGLFLDGPVHCTFAGQTGYGKTMGIRVLIRAVADYNRRHPEAPVSLIILDRKGHDYGDVAYLLGDQCLHLDAHGDLRIGLNGPVGLPPGIWINHLATNFCAPSGLQFAWVTVANMVRWCLGRMNTSPSDTLRYPDFELLLKIAHGPCGRMFTSKAQYLDSLIQILEGIVQASDNLFHTFNGLDLERDVISKGKSAVISMPNLAPSWLRQFVAYILIDQVLLRRIHLGIRLPRTQCIFVIEEADADVSIATEQAFPDGMSPIARNHRMGREFGLGDCLGLGKLGHVSREILDAVTYHVIFRMENPDSIVEGQRTLLLPHRGNELLVGLEKGECLVRLPGPWPHAMLGRIDFMEPNRKCPERFDSHPFLPSSRLADIPELVAGVEEAKNHMTARTLRNAKSRKHTISDAAKALLAAAADHPWVPVAGLWRLLNDTTTPEGRKKACAQLARLNFADFEDLRVGKTSYRLILNQLSGWEYLGRTPLKARGRGGVRHVHCAHWIAQWLRDHGFSPEVEFLVPGTTHHADVGARQPDGRWQVFEVVVDCEDNLSSHLHACLVESTVVSSVIIVAAQQKQLAQLKADIGGETLWQSRFPQIEFQSITKYMTEV